MLGLELFMLGTGSKNDKFEANDRRMSVLVHQISMIESALVEAIKTKHTN